MKSQKKIRNLKRMITSQALCAAMIVSSFTTSLPAMAATASTSYTASLDGEDISYTFTSKTGLPEDGQLTLTQLSDVTSSDVMLGLGLDSSKSSDYLISAVNATFSEGKTKTAAGTGTTLTISSGEAEAGSSNVSVYALPDEYTSDDVLNLKSFKLTASNGKNASGNTCYQWSVSGKQNFVTVIKKLTKVSATANNISFSVSADKDATLSADYDKELASDYQTLLQKRDSSDKKTSVLFAGTVSVSDGNLSGITVSGTKISNLVNADSEISVYELSDSKTVARSKMNKDNLITTEDDSLYVTRDTDETSGEEVALLITSKAAVVNSGDKHLILNENSSTQKEIAFSSETGVELDKYLSSATGTMNGQSTYNTYIEQAYYDETTPHFTETKAPDGIDYIIVRDQSASTTGEKVGQMNTSTEALLNAIKNRNNNLLAKARKGYYTDIDPTGDVVSQMQSHLIKVTGVIGFNNKIYERYHNANGLIITSDSDVQTIMNTATIKDDYADYIASGGTTDSDLQDCTRTDLAMKKAQSWVKSGREKNTTILVLTDGAPYGYGEEGSLHYDCDSSEYVLITATTSNDALTTARALKDSGVTIRGFYFGYNNIEELTQAFSTGDIYQVPCSAAQPSAHITAIFMSLLSSDYPKNGLLEYRNGIEGRFRDLFTYNYTAYDDSRNKFGAYISLPQNVADIESDSSNIPSQDAAASEVSKRTYAGTGSVIHDEVSDAFEITDTTKIKVYQVPRVPANLDASGVPIDADVNGIVSSFKWADKSDWEDITNDSSISVTVKNGSIIEVTGYDYEKNAVVSYDKDLYAASVAADASVYHAGDYGYKLVVEFPINAKTTFGGNNIETNNSDTSVFYPSTPTGYQTTNPSGSNYMPTWEKNTKVNPGGKSYIETYPVPHVDLNINYKIPYDNLTIYAPQTATVDNLFTDANYNIWYVSDAYTNAKKNYEKAKSTFTTASDEYTAAMQKAASNPSDASLQLEVAKKLTAYTEAQTAYSKAQSAYEAAENYIPDGKNNAYVDIHYDLLDPDGNKLGTMDVPHGTAYVNTNGKPNISWNVDSDKLNVTKSGDYTIKCTVTPVDTTRAPGGHVSTEADSDAVKEAVPYDSKSYSATGSSASGSKSAKTITEKPYAHIFQLQITAKDSRLVNNQALDFNLGNENLIKMSNSHMVSYKWVCTDGKTQSNKEDEPGVTTSKIVGSGVTATFQIPDKAEKEGKVKDIEGTIVVSGEDGDYVPVSVLLSRTVGNLNKSVEGIDKEKQTTVYFSDSDKIYGDNSSVKWFHKCSIVDDCDDTDFKDAQDYSTSDDAKGKGGVHYLIHIQESPTPDVNKSTTTPLITKGQDIKWQVGLSNNNEKKNPYHRQSDSSMIDILPYNNDKRIDPDTNNESSKFGGSLYYKQVVVDYSNAAKALSAYKNGDKCLYITSDTSVRTADEQEIIGLNSDASKNIKWTKVEGTLDGSTVTYTITDKTVTALRLDSILKWGEKVDVSMTANLVNAGDQAKGDRYFNEAFVTNGKGITLSETVATTVSSPYISGTVWEDANSNGLMEGNEKRVDKVSVTLYQPHNGYNSSTADRIINGVALDRVYDSNQNKIAPIVTGTDGSFKFDDIPTGTYYIVADYIDDQYGLTKKKAGGTDPNASLIDSEAEESFITASSDWEQKIAKTAWIKTVTVGAEGTQNQNIGLTVIRGSVTVGKILDEIYYSSLLTEEEKANYNVSFTFNLTNTKTGQIYSKTVILNEKTKDAVDGAPQVYAEFEDLPVGTYELTEVETAQYKIDSITSKQSGVTISDNKATFTITGTDNHFDFVVNNKFTGTPPGGDTSTAINSIGMHLPKSLTVKYVGASTISSSTATSYNFTYWDFSPLKGGDIIVTYDDGSQASLSKGTLSFNQLTFSPATVTNVMNSDGQKVSISVFYSEKGQTVSDRFGVIVDLKPVHKFQINFNANGSTFNDGQTRNEVKFGYDVSTASNYVTAGSYKDISNGGLNGRGSNYTYAGWNTQSNGCGVQYTNKDALNAIGLDSGISSLTLYANWKTNVTFNANGGVLQGGTTTDERSIAGRGSGTVKYNVNQSMATGLTATKAGYYLFRGWNTDPNGNGTWIQNYGAVTAPVTFYAVYLETRWTYGYTGSSQSFTAPETGTYRIKLTGARGGTYPINSGWMAGGAVVQGDIVLQKGQTLYIYVGEAGKNAQASSNGYAKGGWNGGGDSGTVTNDPFGEGGIIYPGSGGGATDVRTVDVGSNWSAGLNYRILVAGGGGGGGASGFGGRAGIEQGEQGRGDNPPSGGTQTSGGNAGGGFGYSAGSGGTSDLWKGAGGGGGGWYGGGALPMQSGAGGSSYISSLFTNVQTSVQDYLNSTYSSATCGSAVITLESTQ